MAHPRRLRGTVWGLALAAVAGCGKHDDGAEPVPIARPSPSVPQPPTHAVATAAQLADPRIGLESPWDRARHDVLAQRERPETRVASLSERSNDAVSQGLSGREALWSLLTGADAPFADRAAAAIQSARVFAFDDLPRLMRALGELRREELAHNWGLRPSPTNAVIREREAWWRQVVDRLPRWADAERTRTILGRSWRVPEAVTGWYPRSSDIVECEAAPWPLQVKFSLELVLRHAAPRIGIGGEGVDRAVEWLDAALRMPCDNDDQGLLFVEATRAVTHHVTAGVLARYRALLVDARFPKSTERVLEGLGTRARLARFADPETVPQFHVLLLDAMNGPHPESVRHKAAYEIPRMRHIGGEPPWPEPAMLILQASRRGLDPSGSDEWSRLYAYLLSACKALDAPPFTADPRIAPKDARAWIERYETWFDAHQWRLESAAAAEEPSLIAARARLVELGSR